MRVFAVWFFIAGVGVYAWKDWYKSLCALILLMAVFEHPDMPKEVLDIPGLNPWNILMFLVLIAWLLSRQLEGLKWDMPGPFVFLLLFYLSVVLISFLRMTEDMEGMRFFLETIGAPIPSIGGMWNEYLINCIKWVIPGLLLFDGCRTRVRVQLALAAVCGLYFFLALQTIRWVPLHALIDSGGLAEKTIHILRKEVGYHRTDLSVMLAGASWALLAAKEIFIFKGRTVLIWAGFFLILLGQALTAGRGGYLAWAAVGIVMCSLRYRKLLLVVPVLMVCLLAFTPGVITRLSEGLTSEEGVVDQDKLTAGRSVAWPLVVEKIFEAPFFGYGREAMKRTGIAIKIFQEHNDSAPHPHNAYLEILLDNGVLAFMGIMMFYFLIVKNSLVLFKDRENIEFQAVGGACFAIVGAHLAGSITGQTFYPREAVVGMWCLIGLLFRMVVNRNARSGKKYQSSMHPSAEL